MTRNQGDTTDIMEPTGCSKCYMYGSREYVSISIILTNVYGGSLDTSDASADSSDRCLHLVRDGFGPTEKGQRSVYPHPCLIGVVSKRE